jgi:hypothetical protein
MDKVVLEEIKEEERKERKDKWTKWPIVLGNIANRITLRIVEKHARARGTFGFLKGSDPRVPANYHVGKMTKYGYHAK